MKKPVLKSNGNRPQYIRFQVSALGRIKRHSVILKDGVLLMCQKLREFSTERWESLQTVHFILLPYLALLLINCLYYEQFKQQIHMCIRIHACTLRYMFMYVYMYALLFTLISFYRSNLK